MNKNIELLKNFSIFASFEQKRLEEIADLLQDRSFSEGETIFMEGENGSHMYFLKSGQVKIVKTSPEGKEQIIKFLGSGEVFGEVVLFGIETYPATTICQQKTETLILSRDDFRNYFLSHPEIGWGMLKTMARKLYFTQGRIKSLALKNSRSRTAQALLDLAEVKDDRAVLKDLNQAELASYLGVTRETISRNISKFKDEGLIKKQGSKFIIENIQELEAISYELDI